MPLFQTTRWSLVAGTHAPSRQARLALEELCRIYRPPVLAFIRCHGHSGAEAEDLTQAFFESLLRHHTIARADPERGRFRVFLLTALRRFLSSQAAHERAAKRGGDATIMALEATPIAFEGESPEQSFERHYALTLIANAVLRLEHEVRGTGKLAMFEALREFLLEPPDPDDYAVLAERLHLRRNTIAVAIHRLRSRLHELVQDEIADTLDGDVELASESRALGNALGASADLVDSSAAP